MRWWWIVGMLMTMIVAQNAEGQLRRGVTGFSRNDKVLTWDTQNRGEVPLNTRWRLNFDSMVSTTLNMQTGGERDRWYDVLENEVGLTYAATPKMDLVFSANEEWSKDTFSLTGNSLLSSYASGGVRYRANRDLRFEGDMRRVYDRRYDNEDSGLLAEGRVIYNGQPLRSQKRLRMSLDADAGKSNLKRTNDRLDVTAGLGYEHDFADVSLEMQNRRSLRGYFSEARRNVDGEDDGTNIEEREQTARNLKLGIVRGTVEVPDDRTAFELTMGLGKQETDDTANDDPGSSKYLNNARTNLREFNLKTSRRLKGLITARWEAGYKKNDKDVDRATRSRTETDIITRGELGLSVFKADTLAVFGWIDRTRVDTPEGVPNDRDELKFETGVHYNRYFIHNFQSAIDFRVFQTHFVNIDVTQSSQNKWMKTYLLSPSFVYVPVPTVTVRQEVNLYANQVDYDFEGPVSRSNITRRVSSETWTEVVLNPELTLKTGLMFEENDYGRLNLKKKKIPAEEGLKRFGDISLDYRFTEWLIITPRYIYAVRRDWQIVDDEREPLRREIDQTYGLTCRLFKSERRDYDFELSARRVIRETDRYPLRIRDYITLQMYYGF